MSEEEGISRSKNPGDEASSGPTDGPSAPGQEAGDPAPAVAEQSVFEPFAAVAEARPRGGLVNLLAHISTDPRAVHDAWLDLRSMIEEVVRREVKVLQTKIEAKIDGVNSEANGLNSDLTEIKSTVTEIKSTVTEIKSTVSEIKSDLTEIESDLTEIESTVSEIKSDLTEIKSEMKSLRAEFVMMRWMLGILTAAVIGLLGMVVAMFIFVASDRDRMDSRPETDPIEQTREATLPAPGGVVADEPAASAIDADLGTDAKPAGSPGDADSLGQRDSR